MVSARPACACELVGSAPDALGPRSDRTWPVGSLYAGEVLRFTRQLLTGKYPSSPNRTSACRDVQFAYCAGRVSPGTANVA